MKWFRYGGLALLAILGAGLAVPYLDATGYRERIQQALEQSLHRKVTVGKVRFNLLTGPGFAVDDVTIGEDPAIGIEPIAYVETLDARVRLTTLWTRSLSFSTLRLKEPTVNIAKGDNGVWNFQALMHDAAQTPSVEFPSIQVRGGRINFKIGDYKTIFYLSDADLDVYPIGPDRLDIRFSGQPSRTDHAAENFGRVLGRGVWKRSNGGSGEVEANLELERSGISDLARLVEGHAIGIHGIVASRVRVSGPIDRLKASGQLHLEDVHRWDLLPANNGGWDLRFQGTADLLGQQLELQTDRQQDAGVPFLLRFRASDYLREPKWAATVEMKDAPTAPFIELARHMGAQFPEGFSADGKVTGTLGYSRPGGIQGQFALHDSTVRLRSAPPVNIKVAEVVVDGEQVRVGPSTVALAGGQTAEVEGSYDAGAEALSLDVTTHGMNVEELRTGPGRLLGADAIPVLDACRQGTFRGTLSYRRDASAAEWSGKFDLQNTRLDIGGFDEPLAVVSAHVETGGPKVAVKLVKGKAGKIDFAAEYRRDGPRKPGQLKLEIAEASLAELEHVLLPTLRREGGLLARLRLRSRQMPEWLRTRSIEAGVVIGKLTIGEEEWTAAKARLVQNGASVTLSGIEAKQETARASGEITVDLSAGQPRYTIEGKIEDLPWRSGTLALDGSIETAGTGPDLVSSARGTGTFSAEDVTLAPEGEFDAIGGGFELIAGRRLKLTGLQATQGADAFTGTGATQSDGRMVLELTSGKRVVRVALAK